MCVWPAVNSGFLVTVPGNEPLLPFPKEKYAQPWSSGEGLVDFPTQPSPTFPSPKLYLSRVDGPNPNPPNPNPTPHTRNLKPQPPIQVGTRVVEGRGTCLYAMRDFAQGELVLSSEPLARYRGWSDPKSQG